MHVASAQFPSQVRLPLLHFCLIFLGMICIASPAIAQKASDAASAAVPMPPVAWRPTRALAAHLGKQVQAGQYSLRTPVGYSALPLSPRMVTAEAKYGFETYVYESGVRSDGTIGSLLITIAKLRPGKPGTLPLDVAIQDIVSGKRQNWHDAVTSKPANGSVGGLLCERVYFRGTDLGSPTPCPAQGVAYVTENGGKIVSIVAQVFGPQRQQLWPAVEAAALTIRKN